jgi:hypothetical protein
MRRDIEENADKIFTSNKSQSRAFYQARDRYEAAKKAIGDNELRASGWKRLNDAIAQNETRMAELTQATRNRGETRARIERMKRLAPLLRKIETQEQALIEQADLPITPTGYPARLGEALEGAAKAQESHRKAEAERAEALHLSLALRQLGRDALAAATTSPGSSDSGWLSGLAWPGGTSSSNPSAASSASQPSARPHRTSGCAACRPATGRDAVGIRATSRCAVCNHAVSLPALSPAASCSWLERRCVACPTPVPPRAPCRNDPDH